MCAITIDRVFICQYGSNSRVNGFSDEGVVPWAWQRLVHAQRESTESEFHIDEWRRCESLWLGCNYESGAMTYVRLKCGWWKAWKQLDLIGACSVVPKCAVWDWHREERHGEWMRTRGVIQGNGFKMLSKTMNAWTVANGRLWVKRQCFIETNE